MKLYLMGHTFRYALEQIQMSLFPEEKMEYTEQPFSEGDGTVSALHIGPCYTTAVTTITYHGRAVRASVPSASAAVLLSGRPAASA